MTINDENLIEEITNCLKNDGDVSIYKKNRKISPLVTLLSQLNNFPKTRAPRADFMRVKNQVLDRIALPKMEVPAQGWFGLTTLPQFVRLSAGILGGILIVVSLTLGTAVAALNSVPGQAIYPLKKIVENAQLRIAPENEKANLQIKFANNRLDELQQVIQQQQDGQISAQAAQKIVANTVQDLQKSTKAAARAAGKQPKPQVADKLADLSNKIQIAAIHSEGEVKIELEKALQSTQEATLNSDDPIKTDVDTEAESTTDTPKAE